MTCKIKANRFLDEIRDGKRFATAREITEALRVTGDVPPRHEWPSRREVQASFVVESNWLNRSTRVMRDSGVQ